MEKRHRNHFKSWLASSIVCIAFMYLLGSFVRNFQLEEFELKREKRNSLSEGKKSGFRKLLDKQLEEAKEQRAKLKKER